MEKEYKYIEGYNKRYCITIDGKVYNCITGKELKPRIIAGYYALGLRKVTEDNPRYQKIHKIHRLLAEYFIPNPENKPVINHKDGNKLNNRLDNLEWVTIQENTIHSYANRLQRNWWNKELAVVALTLIESYGYNFADVAKLFGLPSRTYVYHFYTKGYKTFGLKVKNVFIPKHSNPKPLPPNYREYVLNLLKDNTVLTASAKKEE